MKLASFRRNVDSPNSHARLGVVRDGAMLDLSSFAQESAPANIREMLNDTALGLAWAHAQLARAGLEPALAYANTHALDAQTEQAPARPAPMPTSSFASAKITEAI